MSELSKLLQDALDQIVNDRYIIDCNEAERSTTKKHRQRKEAEECWCYDECDGSGVDATGGRCVACRLRVAAMGEIEKEMRTKYHA